MKPSLNSQAGFTLIEVIITLALGSMITAAMTSVFLVLARVQGGLEDRVQTQQVSAIAEQRLAADLASFRLASADTDSLVLAAGDSAGDYTVRYSIQKRGNGPGLVRTTQAAGKALDTQTVHGIKSFTASCADGTGPAVVTIGLIVTGRSGPAPDVKPVLVVTARQGAVNPNPLQPMGCPAR